MNSTLRFVLIAAAVALALYMFVFRGSDRRHPPSLSEERPPVAAIRGAEERNVWLHAGGLTAVVSTYSGAVRHLYLNNAQFRGQDIATTSEEGVRSLRPYLVFEREGRNVAPAFLTFEVEEATPTSVVLVARPPNSGLEVRRRIRAHTEYAFRVTTSVTNHGEPGRLRYAQGVYQWVRRSDEGGGFFQRSWRLTEGLCNHHDRVMFRESREDLGNRNGGGSDNIARQANFVGVGNLYFLSAIAPIGEEPAACHLRVEDRPNTEQATGSVFHGRLSWAPVELPREGSHTYMTLAYFGPKLAGSLAAATVVLRDAQDLGFFAIIARALLKLLQLLHRMPPHNWGLAIILLTVIVRTALYPLLARSTKSLAMMQKLKPELDALNAKYADNQEQKGLATMELYRKHKINPLSGCLPQLAQLPIWWALYTTLQTSVELFHSPFVFWVRDLSAPDRYFVLPLVLGAVMFLQQKLMPPSMPDPMQAKMMLYFMPIFLTAISLFLPAGLALYMLVNSVLAIVQQRITKAQIDRMVAATPEGIEVRPAPPETPTRGGRESGSPAELRSGGGGSKDTSNGKDNSNGRGGQNRGRRR